MKIVYVYDSIARIGGMERILTDKMNYLAEIYGHEVYLITSSQGNHPFSFPLSHKVEHIDLDTKFHLQYQHPLLEQLRVGWTLNHKFEQKFKKEIRLINPDIISGNTSFKADLICKLDCKAKKIIESHCAKIYTRIPANRKKSFFKDIKDRYVSYQCFRDVKRYSDAIVTLTQGDAAMWGQHPNIHIIPNTTSIYGAYNEAVFSMVGENGRKALRTKWFRHVRENGLNISKRFFSLHGLTSALRLRGFSADLRAIALHRACRWG